MKPILPSTLVMTLAAIAGLAAAALDSSQGIAAEWPTAQVIPAAQKSFEVGIDAYREGALEVSVEALSDAIAGNLSNKQLAEALYFRGLAYRELGMPGQAVLDLTSAISLKNGLSKSRLKDAAKNCAEASREAGITSAEEVIATQASVKGPRTEVPIPADRVPVPKDAPGPPAPLATGSISTGQAPPPANGGFVSAVEKLIPEWP